MNDNENNGTEWCVVCDKPRDEWPRDSVLIGEFTRGEINHQREEEGLDPFCGSHDCKMELSEELLDMYGTLFPAARFGGPGWHKL